MNKDKMPLAEIRRILERGEWWDNVRDVSPDEPNAWLDELNGAIEATLDELQAYHDDENDGRLVTLPVKIGQKVYRHQYESRGDYYRTVEWTVSAIALLDGQRVNLTFRRGDEFFHCEYGGANWRVTYMTREEAEATLEELNALNAKARAERKGGV